MKAGEAPTAHARGEVGLRRGVAAGAAQRAQTRRVVRTSTTTSAIRLADPDAIRLADPGAIRFADPMRIS